MVAGMALIRRQVEGLPVAGMALIRKQVEGLPVAEMALIRRKVEAYQLQFQQNMDNSCTGKWR